MKLELSKFEINAENLKARPRQKVFLDCGTQNQQGLNAFIKKLGIDESWIVHSFEANPYTYAKQIDKRIPWVNYHNVAVAWYDGETSINCEMDGDWAMGGSSSIIPLDHWRTEKRYGGRRPTYLEEKVEAINLSGFIKEMCNSGEWGSPEIYIKMDIEGAEVAVLSKLIEDGVVQTVIKRKDGPCLLIEKLYVEFHFDLLVGIDASTETQRIIQYFFQHKDQLDIWW